VRVVIERVVATTALVFLSPVLVTIAAAVSFSSRGGAFYVAERVGKDGRNFKLIKFRTMVTGGTGSSRVTVAGDSRITRLGGFLRRWKLDELPQLVNIAKGEMSFVGPRPEDPKYVAMYTAEQRRILKFQPGLTSPATILYRNEQSQLRGSDPETHYIREILPEKLQTDLAYFSDRNWLSDLGIIMRTMGAIFR